MLTSRDMLTGLPVITAAAFFVQMLDSTILNTALPSIAEAMHRSPFSMQLAVISYTLTVALLIPLSGWLADTFGTRRTFLAELRRELRPALTRMQTSNIAPVDLAQASIGPGMAVYSRYAKVLEADGSELSIRKALQIINQELDAYFTEQEGAMDEVSRVCIALYSQYAFNELSFGEADVLARAKNTSIAALVRLELASAKQGSVHLLDRPELPAFTARSEESLWLVTQQVVHALQEPGVEGCATIVSSLRRIAPDSVKALAYRLYSLADQKGWTQEAYVYNSLVVAWNDIQTKAMNTSKKERRQGIEKYRL